MVTKYSRAIKTLSIAGFIIFVLLMVASFTVYILPHFGWRTDNLSSGSMEPELKSGDLVVTRPVAPEAVEVGDIIAFYSSDAHENLVSHRVVSIERNPSISFLTQGDAYDAPDPYLIPARNLVGRVFFHIPLLGRMVAFMKITPGFLVTMIIPGLTIIATCLIVLRKTITKHVKPIARE